jgi:hypothetical protein
MANAIIHWGGKHSTWLPACKRSFRGSMDYRTTQDAAAVTCTRCAALLGVTPAPRAESRNAKGTCACCFAKQRTRTDGAEASGRMFHHGYLRPGFGYIVGPCPGHGFLPYELSCEGTRYMLGRAKDARENLLKQIDEVTTADKLTARVEIGTERTNDRGRLGSRRPVFVEVEVIRGGAEVVVERMPAYSYLKPIRLTFDTVQAERLAALRDHVGKVEFDIHFFEKKIANWREPATPAEVM